MSTRFIHHKLFFSLRDLDVKEFYNFGSIATKVVYFIKLLYPKVFSVYLVKRLHIRQIVVN